jgi:polyisoprenyl-phosphate glycosyltransferase
MRVKTISIISPCYNEIETVELFYQKLAAVTQELAPCTSEFLFVNDGSTDGTAEALNRLAEQDQRVKVLHLARNQGHQNAITAGLDYAGGDMVVTIDTDLQDPPELIKQMKERIEKGFDVVHAQRRHRAGETFFKLFSARMFYTAMKHFGMDGLVENAGDFRAFTRPVLLTVRHFRERHRFMRGIFGIVGFKQCVIQYDREPRAAGHTKYPFRKMLRLCVDAILSFSAAPIKGIVLISLLLWLSSLTYLAKAAIDHFIRQITVPGWTSIIFMMTFFTGLIIFCVAIIGVYIGRVFEQMQNRPLYWVEDVRNIDLNEKESDLARPLEKSISAQVLGNLRAGTEESKE